MTAMVIGRTGQLATALSGSLGRRCIGRDGADLAEPDAAGRAVACAHPAWIANAVTCTAVDQAESELVPAERINAEAVGEIAASAAHADDRRRGIYRLAGFGSATWAEFVRGIFAGAAARGVVRRTVEAIGAAGYPSPARRPVNATLDRPRFERTFGVAPRPWQQMLAETFDRMCVEVAR